MSVLWLLLSGGGLLLIVLGGLHSIDVFRHWKWPKAKATITGGEAWSHSSRAYYGYDADGWPATGWTAWGPNEGASSEYTFTYSVGQETFVKSQKFNSVKDPVKNADRKQWKRHPTRFSPVRSYIQTGVPQWRVGATSVLQWFHVAYNPEDPQEVLLAPRIPVLGGILAILGIVALLLGIGFWLTNGPIESDPPHGVKMVYIIPMFIGGPSIPLFVGVGPRLIKRVSLDRLGRYRRWLAIPPID